jgi:FkbM family methyltransferase
MIRRILEAYSRNRIIKRRLPKRLGGRPIFVSPDSALQYWNPNLDKSFQSLYRWAERYVRPGDVVWDIGANVGLFSFAAASMAGREGTIIAVEPDAFLIELLRKTAHQCRDDDADITIVPAAVSDRFELAAFSIAERGRSANHLSDVTGSTMHGGARRIDHVMTVTLDWICETCPPPDLVKIDVEGAEMLTLRGGKTTLTAHRPLVICEARPTTRDEVTQFFREQNYVLFNADEPSGELDIACYNSIAVPRERVGHFESMGLSESINAPSHPEHQQWKSLHG